MAGFIVDEHRARAIHRLLHPLAQAVVAVADRESGPGNTRQAIGIIIRVCVDAVLGGVAIGIVTAGNSINLGQPIFYTVACACERPLQIVHIQRSAAADDPSFLIIVVRRSAHRVIAKRPVQADQFCVGIRNIRK